MNDSMIAKLIVKARTRKDALVRLDRALREFIVEGVPTTIPFHKEILKNPDFMAGTYDNNFLDDYSKRKSDTGPDEKKGVTIKRPAENSTADATITKIETEEIITDK